MLLLPPRRKPLFKSLDQFDVVENIGEGAFGVVYKARYLPNNNIYAIKAIDLKELAPEEYENVEKEIKIHSRLQCDQIVQFHDFFVYEDCVYMVMEYCSNGSLFNYLTSRVFIPDNTIRRFFYQTVLGVKYLHDNDIVLRDLKPENILLDDDLNIRICDFGWASDISDANYCSARSGTLAYMSPESLKCQRQEKATDVWALGVLLFELYNRCEPFNSSDIGERLQQMKELNLVYSSNCPPVARELIKMLLAYSSGIRPNINELVNHRYLQDYIKSQENLPKERSLTNEKLNKAAISNRLRKYSILGPQHTGARDKSLDVSRKKNSLTYSKVSNTSSKYIKAKRPCQLNRRIGNLYRNLDAKIKAKKSVRETLKIPFKLINPKDKNVYQLRKKPTLHIRSKSTAQPFNLDTLISSLDQPKRRGNARQRSMEQDLHCSIYKRSPGVSVDKQKSKISRSEIENRENDIFQTATKRAKPLIPTGVLSPEFSKIFKQPHSLQPSPDITSRNFNFQLEPTRNTRTGKKPYGHRNISPYKLTLASFTAKKPDKQVSLSKHCRQIPKARFNIPDANYNAYSIYKRGNNTLAYNAIRTKQEPFLYPSSNQIYQNKPVSRSKHRNIIDKIGSSVDKRYNRF